MSFDRTETKRTIPPWVAILAIFTIANFLAFVVVSLSHGGDAWNGQVVAGAYFVGSHGHYTKVSRNFWIYSYYHTLLLCITFALSFAVASYYTWQERRR